MDGGAWGAAVHGVSKSWTLLNDFTFTFHFHALEKEMATHSSILAWRIPGTEEPDGLPSMGSHKSQTRLRWLSSSRSSFPDSSVGKESACSAGDPGLIPGSGRSPGEGIGYLLQYSCPFPCGSAGKESACNSGDLASIPGLGRSPGEGKGYPPQNSGLENSMDCIVYVA